MVNGERWTVMGEQSAVGDERGRPKGDLELAVRPEVSKGDLFNLAPCEPFVLRYLSTNGV
jgi:hypothetical protein